MNQNRSTTITNSQLKDGYKQTEIGVIPEDWQITSLDSVANLSSGTTPARVQEERYFRNGTYYWVKTTDLNNSKITKTEEKVTKAALDETCLQMYPPGTVLVAMYGGFNQIGRTGLIQMSAAVNQALVAIQANPHKLDSRYLLVNLNYRVEYWKSVASSSRKDPNITSQDIRNFVIPLPPLPEQDAIACTLSDIDALIESLDRLLTKKRQIKQGAMQDLLRSKEGWVEKSLGEVADFFKGKGLPKSEIIPFATYPCIHYGELFTKYPETILNVQSRTNINTGVFYSVANDVLMPTSDVTPNGLATASCILEDRVILGGDVLVIRIDPRELNGSFLSYLIRYSKKQIMQLISGTTVYHLYGSDMRKFSFSMPTIEEQIEIANILSDMDAEIGSIESKLTKTRQLKQGMMHELLTGRIRLVD